VVEGAPLLRE